MDDYEIFDESLLKDTRKNELPMLEMEVTALVNCEPPILNAGASSTDNLAVLENGYAKEIKKKTDKLGKKIFRRDPRKSHISH